MITTHERWHCIIDSTKPCRVRQRKQPDTQQLLCCPETSPAKCFKCQLATLTLNSSKATCWFQGVVRLVAVTFKPELQYSQRPSDTTSQPKSGRLM